LISTILIVGFTIAMAVVVMVWGRDLIGSTQSDIQDRVQGELSCSADVAFSVKSCECSDTECLIQVANDGDIAIKEIAYRLYDSSSLFDSGTKSASLDSWKVEDFLIDSLEMSPDMKVRVEVYSSIIDNGYQILSCKDSIKSSFICERVGVVQEPGIGDCCGDFWDFRALFDGFFSLGSSVLIKTGMKISGDILPSESNVYSLGSSDKVWKDLYLGPDSLYLGENKLSNSEGELLWDGEPIKGGSDLDCPEGFTKLEKNERVLGCIQNNQEGTGPCQTAILDCWNTYGARLPSYSEAYIGFMNYGISEPSYYYEWTDSASYMYESPSGSYYMCGIIYSDYSNYNRKPGSTTYTQTRTSYRCFIEK